MIKSTKEIDKIKKIDTVLFDFDGTIMDTNDIIISSWQYTYRNFTGKDGDLNTILQSFGEPLDYSIRQLFPNHDTDEVLSVYREYQFKHYEEMISLFPGVEEMLFFLNDKGYKMGIVTNRLRRSTDIGLKKFKVEKLFGSVIACNEAARNKPFADPVLMAINQLESKPETSILVGDSANDILCGQNAGVRTVRVSWAVALDDSHDENEVISDYNIETPQELIDILYHSSSKKSSSVAAEK